MTNTWTNLTARWHRDALARREGHRDVTSLETHCDVCGSDLLDRTRNQVALIRGAI